jgi:hypothetical protein
MIIIIMRGENFMAHLDGLGGTVPRNTGCASLVYGTTVRVMDFAVAFSHPMTKKTGGGWGIHKTK